jgi:hypothetical protein
VHLIDANTPTQFLVALDPALRNCGMAIFYDGVLLACACVTNPCKVRGFEAWNSLSIEVCNKLDEIFLAACEKIGWGKISSIWQYPVTVVTETMVVRDKTAGQDVAEIQGVIGAIISRMKSLFKRDLYLAEYTPEQWKGQTPKTITTARLLNFYGNGSTSPETFVFWFWRNKCRNYLKNNLDDSVCIGLQHLGRLRHVAQSRRPSKLVR